MDALAERLGDRLDDSGGPNSGKDNVVNPSLLLDELPKELEFKKNPFVEKSRSLLTIVQSLLE
ncbi:hypothetical protein [Alkalinema sp. FACHB-956]|uniref:hypothetical protein n=1 Tax=Alkalinema sp. FACHB-956 TaxID=2692768 RepID=UPI001689B158|nr:hypothetical protein [Alkalinema sp. FACHB-956]MBD2329083.1 hypothetical protein [Alkalinema sp. FACHB-956]